MQKRTSGLTLIEVLIALAIVGIALTAVIKAASQNIRSTSYLQNKTLALWAGQNVLNEVRVGVLVLDARSEVQQSKTEILGRDYYWEASQEETPNKRIKKIKVEVFDREKADEEVTPVVSLESYVYRGAHEQE